MSPRITRRLTVIVAVLALNACSSDEPTTPTAPTTPTIISETFSGSVTRNGAQTHPFATQGSGTVTAIITLLAPDNTVKMGLALGTWNGSACQLVITKDDAGENIAITGAVSALGSLCVRIYDVGNLTAATDYEIRIDHP
jgi:hypothetical protein